MDGILDSTVSQAEVAKYETKYNYAIDKNEVTDQVQFEYAWCLVRSDNSADIQKGILLLNDLCKKNVNDRRDSMYFLAVGYARLKDYSKAKEMLNLILKAEPTNNQVLQLLKVINEKSREDIKDIAYNVSAGALIVGGIVGLAMAFTKSK
ncbi:mitochondrial fission 1 protein [Arctopsyche grandis]|uniref:mitochondrial fission 1 protein n=1 Tax=Arctopsyche grandis TaxID=121162 RepID=UPI00406D6834